MPDAPETRWPARPPSAIYAAFSRSVVEYMRAEGLDGADRMAGAGARELLALEAGAGAPLPEALRAAYRAFGRRPGPLSLEVPIGLGQVARARDAYDALAGVEGWPDRRDAGLHVLSEDAGMAVLTCPSDAGWDPPVHVWMEGESGPAEVAPRVTVWLRDLAIDTALAAHGGHVDPTEPPHDAAQALRHATFEALEDEEAASGRVRSPMALQAAWLEAFRASDLPARYAALGKAGPPWATPRDRGVVG